MVPSLSPLEPAAKAAEAELLKEREGEGRIIVVVAGGRRSNKTDPTFGQQFGLDGAASGLLAATRRGKSPRAATARAARRIVALNAAAFLEWLSFF
jgi:hypothetical protein